jgi:hypothetical protein
MVRKYGVGAHVDSEDIGQFPQSVQHTLASMFETLSSIGIFTTQPGTADAAGDAVVVRGGFQANQGFAGACHYYNLLVVSDEFWKDYLIEGKTAIFLRVSLIFNILSDHRLRSGRRCAVDRLRRQRSFGVTSLAGDTNPERRRCLALCEEDFETDLLKVF